MNGRQQKAEQLRQAVAILAPVSTDRQISERLNVSMARVEKCRQRLGIKKNGYRHKTQ